jgi:hypothetical protein
VETKELLEVYKSLFDTWRFEVNSHWQRSSYFAAFETVALGACWKLLTGPPDQRWAGGVLSVLGIILTGIWFLNNQKTRYYARHWFRAVCDVEARLIKASGEQGIDFATRILHRHRKDLIGHPYLVQTVPVIFYAAWAALLLRGTSPAMIQSGAMRHAISLEAISLIVGIVSLIIALAATLIAKSSLSQARQVAARDQTDWKQRKWFDLYFKADEAYDALDRFQALYPTPSAPGWNTNEMRRESHDLVRIMRTVHRIAVVFPMNPEVQALFDATAVFKNMDEATSKERLEKVFDAVEGIRQKALIRDVSVLE